MDILALDTSKHRLGWARWASGQPRPALGHAQLGSELTPRGAAYVGLHKVFLEQQLFGVPDVVVVESPMNPAHLKHATKFTNDRLLIGLVEMVYYFSEMLRVSSVREVKTSDWWPYFIGHSFQKRRAGFTTKDYTLARCNQLGLTPRNNDEGDAAAILDYEIHCRGLTPPWRAHECLPLGAVG